MLSDNQGSGPGQVAADTEARVRSVGRLLRENKFCEARRLLEDELALRQNHPKALFFSITFFFCFRVYSRINQHLLFFSFLHARHRSRRT